MGKGFAPDHVLKVDDAPGDHQVAMSNGCLFYPIIPGGVESESRRNLREEVIGRFVAGTYQGAPMAEQMERFYTVLEDDRAGKSDEKQPGLPAVCTIFGIDKFGGNCYD